MSGQGELRYGNTRVAGLGLLALLVLLPVTLPVPVLRELVQERFGVSELATSLFMSVNMVGALLAAPLAGALADHWGGRRALLVLRAGARRRVPARPDPRPRLRRVPGDSLRRGRGAHLGALAAHGDRVRRAPGGGAQRAPGRGRLRAPARRGERRPAGRPARGARSPAAPLRGRRDRGRRGLPRVPRRARDRPRRRAPPGLRRDRGARGRASPGRAAAALLAGRPLHGRLLHLDLRRSWSATCTGSARRAWAS